MTTIHLQVRVYPAGVPLDDALPIVGTRTRLALPPRVSEKAGEYLPVVLRDAVIRALRRYRIVPVLRGAKTRRKARFLIHAFLSADARGRMRLGRVVSYKGFKAKRERKAKEGKTQ